MIFRWFNAFKWSLGLREYSACTFNQFFFTMICKSLGTSALLTYGSNFDTHSFDTHSEHVHSSVCIGICYLGCKGYKKWPKLLGGRALWPLPLPQAWFERRVVSLKLALFLSYVPLVSQITTAATGSPTIASEATYRIINKNIFVCTRLFLMAFPVLCWAPCAENVLCWAPCAENILW